MSPRPLTTETERLRAALHKVALLVEADPAYIPLFERLEIEIALDDAAGDVVERARQLVRQRAIA